jgi:putative endonuclease
MSKGRYDGNGEAMEKGGFVYIVASGRNGTIYVGVTSDLVARI